MIPQHDTDWDFPSKGNRRRIVNDKLMPPENAITRDARVAKAIDEASPLYRIIMRKAYQGNASPRSAIKAQCLICVGYVRDDITHCTGYRCPLWTYRPYQIKGGSHE